MQVLRDMTANGVIIPLAIMLGAIAIVAVIQWRKYRQAEIEAPLKQQIIDLKQQMIERGMSADEIERVLNAQPTQPSQAGLASHLPLKETADYKA